MWALPTSISFAGFVNAWTQLAPNFKNSVMIAVPAALISSMLGSLNGYVLAKWKFRGSDTLFTLILFGMFIPYQSILIPLVQISTSLELYGSIQACSTGSPAIGPPARSTGRTDCGTWRRRFPPSIDRLTPVGVAFPTR